MPVVARLALRTPVLGWMVHDAINGLPDAKYYFAANVAIFVVAMVYLVGYPFLILLALLATFLALSMIVGFTALELFSQPKRTASTIPSRRKPR